jgi:uncharacterized protein (DUF362 family)
VLGLGLNPNTEASPEEVWFRPNPNTEASPEEVWFRPNPNTEASPEEVRFRPNPNTEADPEEVCLPQIETKRLQILKLILREVENTINQTKLSIPHTKVGHLV